jgi:Flp pilus assembly protein TadD
MREKVGSQGGSLAGRLFSGPRLPIALILLALIPRLLFWAEWNHAGLLALPVVDAHTFDQEARGLLRGTWPGAEPFWQAPLYSLFLGGVYRLAGIHWEAARFANALLGAGSCLLLWLLARRFLARRAAAAAFAICALYGPLLYYEGQLLRETLATFLLLLWVVAHLHLSEREHGKLRWLLSGLLLGVAGICRENALILAPAALVWAWKDGASPGASPGAGSGSEAVRSGDPWRRLAVPALFLAGMCLAVAPATAFNRSREPGFIPISSSGGINFYLGNNGESRRTLEIRPGRFWVELVDLPRREGGARTAAERSSFFYHRAARWIVSHPIGFVANTLYKTAGLFTAHEIKRNQGIYEARQGSRVLALLLWKAGPFGFPFGLLGPFSLLGLFLVFRDTRVARGSRARGRHTGSRAGESTGSRAAESTNPAARRLAVLAVAYMIGIILFFPNARYRAPLIPFLAIFGALAASRLLRAVRSGLRRDPLPILVLAAGFVLVDGGWIRAREDPADQAFLRATALAEEGRNDEAIAQLQTATRVNPRHGEAWTTLAALYGMSGHGEESMRAARTALAIDSTDAQAWVDLSNDLVASGDLATAEKDLRRALSLRDDLPDAWLNLGSLQARNGDESGAETSFRRALAIDPDFAKARSGLAQQLARTRRLPEARACLVEGLRRNPADADLWFSLGNIEGRDARWEEAASAFRKCIDLAPENADTWNNYALVLVQLGRTSEARAALEQALRLKPGHAQAEANLRRLDMR